MHGSALHDVFRALIWGHLVAGSVGLVLFWVVGVFSKKGAPLHRKLGLVYVGCMLFTGSMAMGMSTLTLIDPFGTHPHFLTHPIYRDETLVRALFGWLMQFLALLTLSLAWHGWISVRHKKEHAKVRHWFNVGLNVLVLVASVNVAVVGWRLGQPLMLALPLVGLASSGTNLWYAYGEEGVRYAYIIEHFKALVGAGISAYTAFLAFGLVRLMPERVFSPLLWAAPLIVGLTIIFWHTGKYWKLRAQAAARSGVSAAARAP